MKTSEIDLTTAYRFMYPRFTIIVSSGTLSKPNALAVAWSTPLSADPPLIGILIAEKRFSYETIKEGMCFVVNIPNYDLIEETHYVGRISGRDKPNKILEAGLTLEASNMIAAPRIKECKINLECKLVDIITTGDHEMFIGEIVDIAVDSSIRDDWSYDVTKHESIYWRQSKFSSDVYRLNVNLEDD